MLTFYLNLFIVSPFTNEKPQFWANFNIMGKGRPNFGFSFGFGAERLHFNTFSILSVSAKSSHATFGKISVSAAATPNFGFHHQIRYGDLLPLNYCSMM